MDGESWQHPPAVFSLQWDVDSEDGGYVDRIVYSKQWQESENLEVNKTDQMSRKITGKSSVLLGEVVIF